MKRLFVALLLSVGLLAPAVVFAQTQTPQPKPTCRIIALQNSQGIGATVNISWASTNATGGSITTIGSVGPKGIQGVIPLPPATTYTGTFSGPGGTGTCSITIAVTTNGGYGVTGSIGDVGAVPEVGSGLFYVPTYDAKAPAPIATPTSGTNLSGSGGTVGTLNTSGGLVSCGGANDCNICTLSSTVQNLLNFALGLSIPIAAGMFAYAGWLYFSNAESEEKIKRGKRIFRDTLIGFMIALMAWLTVQTLLKALAPGYSGWNSFQCSNLARPLNSNLNNVINGNIGAPQQVPLSQVTIVPNGGGSTDGTVCPDGSAPSITEAGNFCVTANGVTPALYSTGPASISNSEFASLLSGACLNNSMDSNACNIAQKISLNESSGGQNCTTSNTGAVGCMQVLSTTACSLDGSIPGCSTCRNSASAGCADVAQYISDPQINTNLGVKYINQLYQQYSGNCRLTAAAYYQGPGNVQKYGGVPPNAVNYVTKACG